MIPAWPWPLWAGFAAGAAWALWRDPRGREVLRAVARGLAALSLACLAVFGVSAARSSWGASAPPTAPPRRTASLTVEQTLRRLYIAEGVISGGAFETLLGQSMRAGILHRVLAPAADVDAVLDALAVHEAEPAPAPAPTPKPARGPRRGDAVRLDDPDESVEQAEQRIGFEIVDVAEVCSGLGAPLYRLARLGERIKRTKRCATGDHDDCERLYGLRIRSAGSAVTCDCGCHKRPLL